MKQKICFVHIPKCGGHSAEATLTHVHPDSSFLRLWQLEEVGRTFNDASLEELEPFEGLSGHIFFTELVDKIGLKRLQEEYFLCALIRNPVDQVISLFNYVKEYKPHPDYERVQRMSLSEFVLAFTYNQQCAYLATGPDKMEPCGKYTLEIVKSVYDLVVPLEMFGTFNKRVEEYFGVVVPEAYHRNSTKSRKLRRTDLTPKELDLIKEINAEDLYLYEQVSKQYDCQEESNTAA